MSLGGHAQIQELLRCRHDIIVSCASCLMHWHFFFSQVSSLIHRIHVANMWAQGVRTQDSAFTIASTDAMLCDRFADVFSVTCSCMMSAAAAEAEICSVGGGHPSLNEPSPSSSSCSSDAITVFLDEPCVVGKASEGSPVQERPQRQSPLEIQRHVLRGVPANLVLRRCARMFSGSAGSEATYLLSRPTDHLGAFVSHNWSVGRSRKWLALSLQYNFLSALVFGVLIAAVLCVLSSLGWLPLSAVDNRYVHHRGIYCTLGGALVFHVVLLFGSDVLPGYLRRHHEVFLDKVCIHQVDKKLQRQGIESLGGFLFYSWSMVVLYTPVYTKKVWTVYEMACFLCVHPGGRLVWLPVDVAPSVVVASFLSLLFNVFMWGMSLVSIRERLAIPSWLQFVPVMPLAACGMLLFHNTARDQAKSEADLRLFSIRNAVCAVESDRAVVEGNVASLMRDLKLLPFDSTDEEALQVFDLMVQSTLPRAIRHSIGRGGWRYEWIMAIFCSSLFWSFDIVAAQVFAGASVQAVIATMLGRSAYLCAALPLGTALFMQLSGRCTHLSGWRRIVFMLFLSGLWILWQSLWLTVLELAVSVAREDLLAFILLSVVSAASFLLTYFVYRRPPGQQRRQRMGTDSETMEELAEALRSYRQQSDAQDVARRRVEWTSVPMCWLARIRGDNRTVRGVRTTIAKAITDFAAH